MDRSSTTTKGAGDRPDQEVKYASSSGKEWSETQENVR